MVTNRNGNGHGKNGDGGHNGFGHAPANDTTDLGDADASADLAILPAPTQVRERAEACVRFVESALKVKLDYTLETLPLLDHYLDNARAELGSTEKPQALALVAEAAGAYFGEVVRRRHPCVWSGEANGVFAAWQLRFTSQFLSFYPTEFVLEAITHKPQDEEAGPARFELEEADERAVAARLADLPEVSEEEYHSLSTRLEVLDIAIEAIRQRRISDGLPADASLTADDYED